MAADAEIGHEAGVLSHVLFVLCLELLRGKDEDTMSIAVICMLNKVAEHLRAFLRWALPAAMEQLRMSLHMQEYPPQYNNFNVDTLEQLGMLRVFGPIAVRGFTFKVALWLGLRRRQSDDTWYGLILWWNVLYVHFSRASDRLYLFAEDLLDRIQLPSGGPLRKKGIQLGIPSQTKQQRDHDESLVRRHLFLANLRNVSNEIWTQLGIP